jgi:hypothetical protein
VRVDQSRRVRWATGARAAARPRLLLIALGALVIGVSVYVALPAHGGSAASASASASGYGGLPSWLPTASVPVGRVVRASAAHPWLAIEGDTVQVQLAVGQADVTTVGPQVPEEGQFPVPATTPCTFMVTFASASGSVPLAAGAFTITDEHGKLYHPSVGVQGGGAVPAVVAVGRPLTLVMNAVLPTGAGQLSWTPAGGRPIVSWDFDVEID